MQLNSDALKVSVLKTFIDEWKAVSLLDQAWVIYQIQSDKVQVQDEQETVHHILLQECSI
jgi:hypothetical protein